jgi:SAM-dependent methyltransferase
MSSETAKHRDQVAPWCVGNGVDLGSGGDPVVPWALSIDLPPAEAEAYTTTDHGVLPIQWRGDVRRLRWFANGSLDFVYSSHVLEDFGDWPGVLLEWLRVLKRGGVLVLLVPETVRWALAVDAGQPCNHNHVHEFEAGEIAGYLRGTGLCEILEDRWANPELLTYVGTPDYSLLLVARRTG